MSAGTHHITIEQGATYEEDFQYSVAGVPQDLTGYELRGQIRKKVADKDPVVLAELLFVWIDQTVGSYTQRLLHTATQGLPATTDVKKWTYDVELVYPDPDMVEKLYRGDVTVVAEVTRDE